MYLEQQIEQGKRILLSDDPMKEYIFGDGTKRFYQRELDYLISRGFSFTQINDELWEAVK